jgi:hypothetical protein
MIKQWLEQRDYSYVRGGAGLSFETMQPGTFSFRLNIPVLLQSGSKQINIPIDVAIVPINSSPGIRKKSVLLRPSSVLTAYSM